MTSKPSAPEAFLTTEEVLEYLHVRVGRQWRELPIIIITGVQAAAKALGPAA